MAGPTRGSGLVPARLPGAAVVIADRPLTLATESGQQGVVAQLGPPPLLFNELGIATTGFIKLMRDFNACTVAEILGLTYSLAVTEFGEEQFDGYTLPMIRGAVNFGWGGANHRAIFDVRNGTSIAFRAATFDCEAEYRVYTLPWAPETEGIVPPTFQVQVSTGYGSSGRNSNPATLTEVVQIESNADPSNIQQFRVPAFATSLTFIPIGSGASTATIRLVGYGAAYAAPYTVVGPLTNVNEYNVENAVKIPNGTFFIEVENDNSGDTPLLGYLIFGLDLP